MTRRCTLPGVGAETGWSSLRAPREQSLRLVGHVLRDAGIRIELRLRLNRSLELHQFASVRVVGAIQKRSCDSGFELVDKKVLLLRSQFDNVSQHLLSFSSEKLFNLGINIKRRGLDRSEEFVHVVSVNENLGLRPLGGEHEDNVRAVPADVPVPWAEQLF